MIRILSGLALPVRAAAPLAVLLALSAPAAAQRAPEDRTDDQTPAEIAAIDLLNRGQIERGREQEAGRAEALRRAQEQYDAWAREAAHNEDLQAQYRETLRLQDEEYRRVLEDHARLQAACRAGDRAVCDAGWLARGLNPPAQ